MKKRIINAAALVAILSFAFASPLFAQIPGPQQQSALGYIDPNGPAYPIGTHNPMAPNVVFTDPNSFAAILITFVNWFSWFIALAAVVMGLYSGFLFITARGDPTQLKTAQKTILWAIIGIAVAILAFGIIALTMALI